MNDPLLPLAVLASLSLRMTLVLALEPKPTAEELLLKPPAEEGLFDIVPPGPYGHVCGPPGGMVRIPGKGPCCRWSVRFVVSVIRESFHLHPHPHLPTPRPPIRHDPPTAQIRPKPAILTIILIQPAAVPVRAKSHHAVRAVPPVVVPGPFTLETEALDGGAHGGHLVGFICGEAGEAFVRCGSGGGREARAAACWGDRRGQAGALGGIVQGVGD
jgi:hypothetical protein